MIKRLLWSLAGANIFILKMCPSDQNKFLRIGLTILLTGIFAGITAGWAIYSSLKGNIVAGILIGIIWGVTIMNIDSLIVSTIKMDGTLWDKVKVASIRIILAIFIGIVIARPFELKLFEEEIKDKLVEIEMEKCSNRNVKIVDNLDSEIEGLENQLRQLEQDFSDIKKEIDCHNQWATKEEKMPRKRKTTFLCNGKPYPISPRPSRGPITDSILSKINELTDEKNKILKDINSIKQQITAKKSNVTNLSSDCSQADIKRQIDTSTVSILKANYTLNRLIAEGYGNKHTNKVPVNGVSQDTTINRDTTTSNKNTVDVVIDESENKNGGIAIMIFFITLLIVFVETAPILVKLMQSEGEYERKLKEFDDFIKNDTTTYLKLIEKYPFLPARKEYLRNFKNNKGIYESLVQESLAINEINLDIQSQLEILQEKLSTQKENEKSINSEVLEQIKTRQINIVNKLLDAWETNVLEDLDKNPEKYFTASSNNANKDSIPDDKATNKVNNKKPKNKSQDVDWDKI